MLTLSARQAVGTKHPGQENGVIRWHGRQPGVVPLSDRKLRVSKPLGLPMSLRRCLGTTNVIESPYGTVRQKIGRVRRWRDAAMVLRWAASAFLASEKAFRRLMGSQQLWMLEACLNDSQANETMDHQRRVG